MDTIFIKDLTVRGKHGVSDEERAREQEFSRLTDAEVADVEEAYRASFAADAEARI